MIYTDGSLSIEIEKPNGTEYIGVTRVSSGAAATKVETLIFKDDNSTGEALKTLTFTYDGNGDFASLQEG